MAEKLILDAPLPATSEWNVVALYMSWENAAIVIDLKSNTDRRQTLGYNGAEATALMISLNKANLSTKSLQRRIIEKLIADGKISTGTITGSPD